MLLHWPTCGVGVGKGLAAYANDSGSWLDRQGIGDWLAAGGIVLWIVEERAARGLDVLA